jgi:hypothetical protein
MAAAYKNTSPYYGTPMWGNFLDVWAGKTIAPDVSDARYQIDPAYNGRPDLLAYDYYKNSDYWWTFAIRNPDVIKDPLLDFKTGVIIYLPTLAVLKHNLGI